MAHYILECVAFQLVFLIVYDFFLKRETFFQWNRAYLLSTHLLSLLLPWAKIEALKTTVPTKYYMYPDFLWDLGTVAIEVKEAESPMIDISWQESFLYLGMLLAILLFGVQDVPIVPAPERGQGPIFFNFYKNNRVK